MCSEDDEVSAGTNIGDGFIVGSTRGNLQHFNSDCNFKWEKQAHEGEIRQILYDQLNRLIFSLGNDGKVIAWPERNTEVEEERKTITFKKKQITFMSLSPRNTLLAVGNSQDRDLTIWNYEVLGLLTVIEMDSPVVAVNFSNNFDLLSIATNDGKVHFLKYVKKEHDLNLTKLQEIDISN